jgi:hypothetical protein
MSRLHSFQRPEVKPDARQVGTPWSADYQRYDEGARFLYQDEAYELTLFWKSPSSAEARGFAAAPVELALYSTPPAAFLLYKIAGVCEWSDVAFNAQRIPAADRQQPQEPPGERAHMRLFLVDADTGLIVARRLVALEKILTQALKNEFEQQFASGFNELLYDAAVQSAHARFADGDAMLKVADVHEVAHG